MMATAGEGDGPQCPVTEGESGESGPERPEESASPLTEGEGRLAALLMVTRVCARVGASRNSRYSIAIPIAQLSERLLSATLQTVSKTGDSRFESWVPRSCQSSDERRKALHWQVSKGAARSAYRAGPNVGDRQIARCGEF